jgi:hypothetical protein
MNEDGFAHELDEQFARLRDSTMTFMPDPEIRDMFDACLPTHLRSSRTDRLAGWRQWWRMRLSRW